MKEIGNSKTKKMILTRHLYDKKEVFLVLMVSLLNRDKERTMYWAFELYYSGFQTEVFDHLLRIYKKFYQEFNPKFEKFFLQKYRQWSSKKEYMTLIEKDRLLSIILLNLLCRKSNQSSHCKEIYVFVHIRAHIYYYKGDVVINKPYNVLKIRCLYGINDFGWLGDRYHRNIIDLFDHWEYYAYHSPIWKERIQKYKGIQDHKNKKIVFLNLIYEQEFYDKYGYEPDEQSVDVQKRILYIQDGMKS